MLQKFGRIKLQRASKSMKNNLLYSLRNNERWYIQIQLRKQFFKSSELPEIVTFSEQFENDFKKILKEN